VANYVNRSGLVLGVSAEEALPDGTYVMWQDGAVVRQGGGYPNPFSFYLRGLSDDGQALLDADAGDQVFVWKDGVNTLLPNPYGSTHPIYQAQDITPDGLSLGFVYLTRFPDYLRETGIWRDGAFEPLGVPTTWKCTALSDGGHILCTDDEREYPFVTTYEASGSGGVVAGGPDAAASGGSGG
jgi:hypothetical protein